MKRLCIFIHFSQLETIPVYVNIYINELTNYFDEVAFVYNERHLEVNDLQLNHKISFFSSPNDGYDFGHFYRYYSKIDFTQYSQIACVNDSNILLNKLSHIFEWANNLDLDFWGLLDSFEKPWFSSHQNNHHIQSHFLVFNKRAISELNNYFKQMGVDEIFAEKDPKQQRRLVIDKWEIGFSRYLFDLGLNGKSFISSKKFLQDKNDRRNHNKNIAHIFYKELIESGVPILKKKVILEKNWKDIFKRQPYWNTLLRMYGNKDWNIEGIITEMELMRKN